MKCSRCRTEYDPKSVKQYAWGARYCCVECFLNKPKINPVKKQTNTTNKFQVGDIVTVIGGHRKQLIGKQFVVENIRTIYYEPAYLLDTKKILKHKIFAAESILK